MWFQIRYSQVYGDTTQFDVSNQIPWTSEAITCIQTSTKSIIHIPAIPHIYLIAFHYKKKKGVGIVSILHENSV